MAAQGSTAANPLVRVDVAEIIAARRLGRFHLELTGLCVLAMLVVGYNTQVVTSAAPAIARALGLRTAGPLDAVALSGGLGTVLGAIAVSMAADWIGRKPVILGALLLVTICTIATAFTHSVGELIAIRFVTGWGLGALMPATLALTAELVPRRHKITLTMIVWLGLIIGAGLAGPVTANLVTPPRSWAAAFIFGGLLPLILVPVLWTAMPESILVLTRRGEPAAPVIRATLIRISRRYDFLRTTDFVSSERVERGFPLLLLFREGRTPLTLLLWVAFGANFMALSFLSGWLPAALRDLRLAPSTVVLVSALTQMAGIAGAFAAASLAGMVNRFAVLAGAWLLGALALIAVAIGGGNPSIASGGLMLAGFFVIGAQAVAIAIAASAYPTPVRATGLGWALGAGLLGQAIAPFVSGELAAMRWSAGQVFIIAALLAVLAAGAAAALAILRRDPGERAAAGGAG